MLFQQEIIFKQENLLKANAENKDMIHRGETVVIPSVETFRKMTSKKRRHLN